MSAHTRIRRPDPRTLGWSKGAGFADATSAVAQGGEGGRVTREEPRRWDWWLAGCGALAAILVVIDVAAVVSDDVAAGAVSAPRTSATAASSSGEAAVDIPSSRVPVPHAERAFTGECEGFLARGLPSGSHAPAAASATRVWNSAIRSGLC
ncbi:MAG TPA: hypothetical protein VF362_04570 [Demequinaceae bacterium]